MYRAIFAGRAASAIAGLLLPALAVAWTPYDYGPPTPAGPTGAGEGDEWAAPAGPRGMPTPPMMPGYGGPPIGDVPAPGYGARGFDAPPDFGGFGPPRPGEYGPPWATGFGPGYGRGPVPGGAAPGGAGQGPADSGSAGRAYPAPGSPPMRHRPGGLRVSQTMTDDAYVLEIPLEGQSPESIHIEARGQGLLIRRDSSTEMTEESERDQGRGYSRRYSYSTGRQSRRLSVPRDADLAALTREDSAELIRVSIPRQLP